ncbi:MAG: NUDIX domain-containing protein [Candidatus Lokiarchaeota archaeon]|jgi:8-oxo-dGTP pyrophosphatase MutT (NUDIX family)|nr:NUDIX domain-containing protein [Candidatus Lokiarchaeota archaeon]
MEKFTQIKDAPIIPEDDVLFSGNHIDIVKYKDTEILKVGDKVAVLPYFRDEATFLMRLEYTPAYQLKNREHIQLRTITNYLTITTGGIEKGETPEQTIRRELYEENGIVLNNMYPFEIEGPFFTDKYNTSQIYVCLLELPVNSYRQVKPPTDGSEHEKLSKPIRISIGDINQIVNNDLISKYLIDKLIKRIADGSR